MTAGSGVVVFRGAGRGTRGRIALDRCEIEGGLECDALQGYAFSKPLSPGQFERFVANWQAKVQAA